MKKAASLTLAFFVALGAVSCGGGSTSSDSWQEDFTSSLTKIAEQTGASDAGAVTPELALSLVTEACGSFEAGDGTAAQDLDELAAGIAIFRQQGASVDDIENYLGSIEAGMSDRCKSVYDNAFPIDGVESLKDLANCQGDPNDFTGDLTADFTTHCTG